MIIVTANVGLLPFEIDKKRAYHEVAGYAAEGLHSEATAPAVLPRHAKSLEVMLAMGVVAADAVELHGLMTVHRQHERPAEANALQFNVTFDAIDRCASTFEISSV